MSSNDGNTPRNRGRHGDDDYRTFPRRSSEVPRTFPSDSDRSDSTSPRRDSDPSRPGSGQPGQGTGQPGQGTGQSGQSGQGTGSSSPGYSQSGQGSDQTTRSNPATTGFGASSGDDRTRVQPTYAQSPVDSSRPGSGADQSGRSAASGPASNTTGQGTGSGQYGSPGQSGSTSQPGAYGQGGSTSQSGAYGQGSAPSQGGAQNPSGGYGQTGGYGRSGDHGQSTNSYGQPSGSQGQTSDSRGQSSSASGGAAAAGFGAAAGYAAGHQGSNASGQQGGYGTSGTGQPGSSGGYPGAGASGQPGSTTAQYGSGSSSGPYGSGGQYGASGQSPYGTSTQGQYGASGQNQYASGQNQYASGQGQYASAGAGPYATDSYGAGGQGPDGTGQPPRREKRGPGWAATIAIALIAALIGGGAAFGGSYAISAMQEDTESRKVADQTIETPDWTEVAKDASQSVVSIQAAANGRVVALGSGSLYDDQGHVITNNHVVAPSDTPGGELTVTMKSGATMKAEIVGRDPSTDIAIIKLDQVPEGVKPLPIGDSKALSVGDPVMALGNPLGLADSVTTGIVSALDRPVTTENIGEDASSQQRELTITNAIQTDAAINPGNSGGPLVDGNGNFIGVNSAAASLGQGEEGQQSGSIGIGFAIPASQAVMIADQLIATGTAQHPFLGVRLTDGQINTGGITRASAKVQSVEPGSPADQAGFQDGDDVIAVGDTKVTSAISLQALVRAQPVNTPVEFTIVRGGQEQKLSVSLILK